MARGSATKYPKATPARKSAGTINMSGSATFFSCGLKAGRTKA